jgi:wyosine [tRNA(Phe)-imidazoG37] synthetase (radical SAM superfamily)
MLANGLIFQGLLRPSFVWAFRRRINRSQCCMNYIFGPVHSRRLGRSLGIDLFSSKICNLNCVYCEVGRTITPACRRGAYSPVQAILDEIDRYCTDTHKLDEVDVLTVTAKGEPTLHSDLGDILRYVKGRTEKPVAVLTNGTTLMESEVRQALMLADIVVPSLDAARWESFFRVDRPVEGLDLNEIIQGLTLFSHAYAGKLWLEILLVRGMNDAPEDIGALIAAIRRMRVDRIQLNTVVRPPAVRSAQPLSKERLVAIADLLQKETALPVDLPFASTVEQVQSADMAVAADPESLAGIVDEVMQMVQRRPSTAVDIDRIFHLGGPEKVEQLLAPLVLSGIVRQQDHGVERYYHLAS